MTITADPAVDLDPYLDFDPCCELDHCGDDDKATHKAVNTWCGCFWLACDACAEHQRQWIRRHDHVSNWGCCGCETMTFGTLTQLHQVVPL